MAFWPAWKAIGSRNHSIVIYMLVPARHGARAFGYGEKKGVIAIFQKSGSQSVTLLVSPGNLLDMQNFMPY